jgi:two-component system, chemotaxis family, protein-glutamate methylesterase/glutaminase
MTAPIRILIVDDSAVFRMVLARVIRRTPGMDVVGLASDGREALDAARRLDPDVVTLDVEMPELDGLTTLGRLLAERPTRVVMLSRATRAGAEVTLDALRAGAIDAIGKPDAAWGNGPSPFVDDLIAKIRAAALVPRSRILATAAIVTTPSIRPETRATLAGPAGRRAEPHRYARALVVVATSTGGPRALDAVLSRLPPDLGVGVIVVQHMLTGFTATLADRLDRVGPLRVREATTGVQLEDDLILIAPGDRHILVDSEGRITLDASPRVNGLRPAADVTLLAAAPVWGQRLLSVVLTGMGRDGSAGARATRAHGGFVLAQDEATSAVFGMPRAIAEAGLADRILPLDQIAAGIVDWAGTLADPGPPLAKVDLRNGAATADTKA